MLRRGWKGTSCLEWAEMNVCLCVCETVSKGGVWKGQSDRIIEKGGIGGEMRKKWKRRRWKRRRKRGRVR